MVNLYLFPFPNKDLDYGDKIVKVGPISYFNPPTFLDLLLTHDYYSSMVCYIDRDIPFIDNFIIYDELLDKDVDHSLSCKKTRMIISPGQV